MEINLISGKKLKLLLKKRGILQKEICEKFNIHQTLVSRYFTDDIAMPASFIVKVAKYANMNISDLIEGDEYITDIPHKELAAEPEVVYDLPDQQKKEVSPLSVPSIITIDTTVLEQSITILYDKIKSIEEEIIQVKESITKELHY